jgi:hypothetical protein
MLDQNSDDYLKDIENVLLSRRKLLKIDISFTKLEDSVRKSPALNHQPLIYRLQQKQAFIATKAKENICIHIQPTVDTWKIFFFSHLWGVRKFCKSTLRKLLPFQDMMKFSTSELRKFFNLTLQKFSTLRLLLKTSLSSTKNQF